MQWLGGGFDEAKLEQEWLESGIHRLEPHMIYAVAFLKGHKYTHHEKGYMPTDIEFNCLWSSLKKSYELDTGVAFPKIKKQKILFALHAIYMNLKLALTPDGPSWIPPVPKMSEECMKKFSKKWNLPEIPDSTADNNEKGINVL